MKATKMYSDAKYPAFSTYKEYESFIGGPLKNLSQSLETNNISLMPSEIRDSSKLNPTSKEDHYTGEPNLQEKLQFYYVMGKPLKKAVWPERPDDRPVSYVSSVSALLLDEESNDRLSHLPVTENSNAQRIEDAPDSIVQPWNSMDFESPSYLYAPALGEVFFVY